MDFNESPQQKWVPEVVTKYVLCRRPRPDLLRVFELDKVWRHKYYGKTFHKEFSKMFVNINEDGERINIESLRSYIFRSPKDVWWLTHFIMCLQEFLIEKISYKDCQDPEMVASVINLITAFEDRVVFHVQQLIDDLTTITYPSVFSVPEGINYKELNVARILGDRNLLVLKLLIRYGVITPQPPTPDHFNPYLLDKLTDFFRDVSKPFAGQYFYRLFQNHLLKLPEQLQFGLKLERNASEQNDKAERRLLVSMVLTTFNNIDRDPENKEDGVKCLRYFFEAIPDPFVVLRDMNDAVLGLEELNNALDLSVVKEKFDRFASFFPDWNVYEPRTLKHLSRCAARDYLCKRGTLPRRVSKLSMPKRLKDYLLIVNISESS